MVGGPMSEAKDRCLLLDDVEEDTVALVLDFMYRGDYKVPEPEILPKQSDVPDDISSDADRDGDVNDDWNLPDKRSKKKPKSTNLWVGETLNEDFEGDNVRKKDQVWNAFIKQACVHHVKPWEPRSTNKSREDYTKVFLCHAKLYVFSDRYGIHSLRDLTLQKLRLTLSRFTLHTDRVPDVVELIKYTYSNTVDHEEGMDVLRSLVLEYAICNLEHILKDETFRTMLVQEGVFAREVVERLLRRLD